MKAKSRKEVRKEFRRAKKIKKHEFFSKKKPKNKFGSNFQRKNISVEMKGKENIVRKKDIESTAQKVEKAVIKDRNRKEFKNPQERQRFEKEKEKKEKDKLDKRIQEQRIKQLKMDNLKEDIEIKKLEKQLKMHKGKSKAFASDGWDYLLDICDRTSSKSALKQTFEESDSDFESDLENVFGESEKTEAFKKGKRKKKKVKTSNDKGTDDFSDEEEENEADSSDKGQKKLNLKKRKIVDQKTMSKEKKVKFEESDSESDFNSTDDNDDDDDDDDDEEEEGRNTEDEQGEGDEEDEEDVMDEENEEDEEDEVEEGDEGDEEGEVDEDEEENVENDYERNLDEGAKAKVWEDIYGRTRDEKGNVVKTYTPPHLRKKLEGLGTNEKLSRLKKQLKGLLNRLSESNMTFISNQIEQLYMQNSRNDMNETLCGLFSDSLVTEVLTPERLITEHAMLIAVLHANIGSEIGAHFLQFCVTEFSKLLESNPDVEDKRINNILIFIMHLYNFQIFHSKLMYDIINELLKNLEEKQIELLLATFKTVGFNLRKDDPLALKSLVLKVQEKAKSVSTGDNSSRIKFMLDILMAIKNNNMSKIPNYNPEFVEKLRKNLKVLVRKGNYSTELNISLQDLLNAEKHGRWWIVGSAWSGSAPSRTDSNELKAEELPQTKISQKLLELARKQRMNTDVRRNIFCILMSAEDYLEAFEKLLKLKLKGAVEREIMNILLHCALQEKNFNLYYVFLANKFCMFDRKYQMMLQCAVWDKIKELKNMLPVQVSNLAKFIGNVILERGLPISVLKVIEFSELDKPTIKFMRQVLLTVLISENRSDVAAVFKRIADSPKLNLFRESLRLFLRHFVLKNTAENVQDKMVRLSEMVKVAENALSSSDGRIVF